MLSREAQFALKGCSVANFRALQGTAAVFKAVWGAVLSRVCSIFYMTIV